MKPYVLLLIMLLTSWALHAAPAPTTTTTVIEANEKDISNIELATVYKEDYEAIYTYESTIFPIANQCILAGGKAVLRARLLYGYINPQYYFDDYALCAQAGLLLRKKEGDIHLTKVYPNPADALLQIKLFEPCQRIELLSEIGNIVTNIKCNDEKLEYQIDTQHINSGFYLIKVIGSNNETMDVIPVALIH
jgi:hypothetical protein